MMQESKATLRNKIDYIILSIVITHEAFFFCINSLLGKQYLGSSSSNIYRIYLATLLIYLIIRFFSLRVINVKAFLFLAIPVLFVIIAEITQIIYGKSEVFNSSILYILVWQYMGIFLAINLSHDTKALKYVISYLKYVVIILTISLVTVAVAFYGQKSSIETIGGTTYQAASYYGALCFGLTLYFARIKENSLKNTFVTVMCIILLVLQFVVVVLSGGRGAMILLLSYVVYFIITGDKNTRFRNLLFCLIIAGLLVFIINSMDANLVSKQFQRIFSYISSNGIDLSKTSGRDYIYEKAIKVISESPLLGHGLLSYYYSLNGSYPHNFFLETLIEGGIVYTLVWIAIIIKTIKRILRIEDKDRRRFIVSISLYPACMLMFSGTYSYSMLFWFAVTFSYLYFQVNQNGKSNAFLSSK